jgi:tetratricopeptide (TPR) repeat protein
MFGMGANGKLTCAPFSGLADVFAVQDEITEAIVAAILRRGELPRPAQAAGQPRRHAALAAIRADNEDPWAHYALGCVYLFARRFDDSLAELELALRVNPNFSLAQGYYGLTLSYCGRWEEGDLAARRALRLSPRDPCSAIYYGIAAYAQFVGRNYSEAMRLSREGIRQPATSSARIACSPPPPAWPGRPRSPRPHSRSCVVRSPIFRSPGSQARCRSKQDADREHYLEAFRRAGLD